jgi:hypothetical protein
MGVEVLEDIRRFGVVVNDEPYFIDKIGHRGGEPGYWTGLVINGNWYCRLVLEGPDAPYMQCPRPYPWRQPIQGIYLPSTDEPLPADCNEACEVIRRRAAPLQKTSRKARI